MKEKVLAKVLSHNMLCEGIYDLWLETSLASQAHAGQFVGVYTQDKSRLLPRPISICEVSDDFNAIRLVYRVSGEGTGLISQYEEGDEVAILGILGNGYIFTDIIPSLKGLDDTDVTTKENPTIVLLGGGIGVPPMLELAKELTAHGFKPTVIAGYRDSNMFLAEDFKKYSDFYVATEDGSFGTKGNVMDAINELGIKPDIIMACGPMPMLRAIKRYTESKDGKVKAYISLEERMACGVGACLGCVVKTKKIDAHSHVNNARICTDGPVFDADDVEI